MHLWHRRLKQNVTAGSVWFSYLLKKSGLSYNLQFHRTKILKCFYFYNKNALKQSVLRALFYFFNKTYHSQVVDCICQDFASLKQHVLHLHRSQRKVTVGVSSKDLHKWNLFWKIYGNTYRSKHFSSKCRTKGCLCSWIGIMLSVSGFKYNVTYINVMQI